MCVIFPWCSELREGVAGRLSWRGSSSFCGINRDIDPMRLDLPATTCLLCARTGSCRQFERTRDFCERRLLRFAHRDATNSEEEGTSGIRILWPQSLGVAADVPQGSRDLTVMVGAPYLARGSAACLIGGERGEVIIGPPTRELGPFDRLELAACEFQGLLGRFLGRSGAGCEIYDCA